MSQGILVLAVRVRILQSATIGKEVQTRTGGARPRFEGALRKITAWTGGNAAHRPATSLHDAFTFDMQNYVIEYNGIFEQKIVGDRERLNAKYPNLQIDDEKLSPRLILVKPERPTYIILESGPILRVRVEDSCLAQVETMNSLYEVRVLS